MKIGDIVRVHPHGSPDRASEATVMMVSENQRSAALSFKEKPAFVIDKSGGMALHREHGYLVMLVGREALDGKPWGPWIEIFGCGHFEIEETSAE